MEISEARDALLEFHQQLAKNGEGFIMRMSDNPAGVIAYTPSKDANRLHQITSEAYQYLKRKAHILS